MLKFTAIVFAIFCACSICHAYDDAFLYLPALQFAKGGNQAKGKKNRDHYDNNPKIDKDHDYTKEKPKKHVWECTKKKKKPPSETPKPNYHSS